MTPEASARFSREEALGIAAQALEVAKQAKSLGQDVKVARDLMRECRDAMMRGDYPRAVWFAEETLRIFGGIPPRFR